MRNQEVLWVLQGDLGRQRLRRGLAGEFAETGFRCEAAWPSTPRWTAISAAGTFHSAAAVATNTAHAAAPAWRSCIQEFAIAVLPPAPCTVPNARLLYSLASAGALSTRICAQSASSSSATMVARPV